MVKHKEIRAETDTADYKSEAQGEFNSIVGSGVSESTTIRNEESTTVSAEVRSLV